MDTSPAVPEIGVLPAPPWATLIGPPDAHAFDDLEWQTVGYARHARRPTKLRSHPPRSSGDAQAAGSATDAQAAGSATGERMIRVLLAEPARLFRDALAGRLGREKDLQVVAKVAAGDTLAAKAEETRPDVAVVDAELPGFEVASELQSRLPECRVLILAGAGRPGVLRKVLSADVAGFLVKDACPGELVDAIRDVATGDRVMDPRLLLATLNEPASPLTERETQVLGLAASGAELSAIAVELSLSYGTVRNYLASAVTKLNARNRVDAIRIAGEAGWI